MSTEAATGAPARPLHVCLVAGEHSGDHMGALIMRALKARLGGNIRFSGVGGTEMIAEGADSGFESFFPMEELAVAGIFEILPHVRRILRRINDTVARVRELHPDILVTIDSPAFAFRVGRKLQGSNICHVHYVAPSVWAWRPRRAKMIAGFLDHLLTIFPFEAPYFEKWGLGSTFIGHPTAEMGLDTGDGAAFRAAHGIASDQPLLCVLPGSRHSETAQLLPIYGETVARLKKKIPNLAVVVPTVATVASEVRARVTEWPVPVIVTEGMDAKRDVFAAADAALAASGTVTYELAMAGLPMVVAYRMSPASAFVIRRMVKIKYASVVNIVLGRQVVAECIQQDCTPENLAREVQALLTDPAKREKQKADLAEVAAALGRGMAPASEIAADALLSVIRKRRAAV